MHVLFHAVLIYQHIQQHKITYRLYVHFIFIIFYLLYMYRMYYSCQSIVMH